MMDRQAWLEERRTGIGGSDAPTLLDANPYWSRLALYYDKIGEGPPNPMSKKARYGSLFESAVKSAYEEDTGRRLLPGLDMERHPEYPWMLANTDAIIAPVDEYPGEGIYEGKVSWQDAQTRETQSGLVIATWAAEEGVPLNVQIQGQWYCTVGDRAWVGFACLLPDRIKWERGPELLRHDMPRNDRFSEVLCEAAYKFWHEHVLPRIPPLADGSEASLKALRYAFPKSNGRVYLMPSDIAGTAADYKRIKAEESAAKKRAKVLGNTLRQAMGDAAFALGETADGEKVALSYKEKARGVSASTVLEAVEELLGAEARTRVEIEAENRQEPNREFRIASVKTVEKALAENGPAVAPDAQVDEAGEPGAA